MRKHNRAALLLMVLMIAESVFLAGCGSGSDTSMKDIAIPDYEPGSHVIYGVNYPAQADYWMYSFNAEQLGDGEEWIDFDITCWQGESPGIPYDYETKEVDGKEAYYYSYKEETGGEVPLWSEVIMIPLDGKYIEIRSDFIEKNEKKKAEKFFKKLFDEMTFIDYEGHVVCADYLILDGLCIPAEGLKPSQFFIYTEDMEIAPDCNSLQIDFSEDAYEKGIGNVIEEFKKDKEDPILDGDTLEIDGVEAGWYTRADDWSAEESDMMPYLTHVIMVPADEVQSVAFLEYNFNGDIEDFSIYDEQIKALDENIHIMPAEKAAE